MDIVNIIGIGIIGAFIAVLLRQYKPEYALGVSLATGVIVFAALIGQMLPVVDGIRQMLDKIDLPMTYINTLLKALGVCYVTQLACDTCKDAGEIAIASKVELAGKAIVILLTLPLFYKVIEIASEIIWM